jgi:hypothetical protein
MGTTKEQVSSSRSYDLDCQEIRTKLLYLMNSRIYDGGLCIFEYRLLTFTKALAFKNHTLA